MTIVLRCKSVFVLSLLSLLVLSVELINMGMNAYMISKDSANVEPQRQVYSHGCRLFRGYNAMYEPHLPACDGYVTTWGYFYRYLTVRQQLFMILGEAKHGLWRIQESGSIRVYLRKGTVGVKPSESHDSQVLHNYSYSLDASERYTGSVYARYLDLPFSHKLFGLRDVGTPDLPYFYCTLSEENFESARSIWEYVTSQPGVNAVGPLGKRAGLGMKVIFPRIVRVHLMPNASIWINSGMFDKKSLETNVSLNILDLAKNDVEVYLVERVSTLNVVVIIDSVELEYQRGTASTIPFSPRVNTTKGIKTLVGFPGSGMHHVNRLDFTKSGGLCPQKGGDFSNYPGPSGSGFVNNLEEITPLCDSVLIDLFLYANLGGYQWNEDRYMTANAPLGTRSMQYTVEMGNYGVFTDPFLVDGDVTNPQQILANETDYSDMKVARFKVNYEEVGTYPNVVSSF
jgi:hypothetical protein